MESNPWRNSRRRSGHRRKHLDRHGPGRPKGKQRSERSSSKSREKREVKPTSSFSSVKPSSAPIALESKRSQPKPVWRGYLLALAGVTLLILIGGGHNVFALSLSLILPGAALFLHPPTKSPGRWLDRMALAFLALLLLAFIPQFYWPDAAWRDAAREVFEIDLPASLSVHPWLSFEAWLMAVAGIAWFYAASSWEINHPGRKWFYFILSMVVGGLALVVLWGNATGLKYPAAESSPVFSFFPNRNQTANFLAVGGVVAFGYVMCASGRNKLLPIAGLLASGACFLALVWGISRAGVLLFFAGLALVYLLHVFTGRASRGMKLGFPLLVVAFSVFLVSNSRTTERVVDFFTSSENWSGDFRVLLARDTLSMIGSAPLTGHGLGTFEAIFPQYRELSANFQRVVHPESDLLWLASEAGVFGLAALLGFIAAYLFRCRRLSDGPGGGYRLAALAAVVVFLLHALVDVSGHRPGTAYFAILLAVLALPQRESGPSVFKPRMWRIGGGGLVVLGLLWGLSGVTGLPFHSSVAVARHESKIEASVAEAEYAESLRQVDKWIAKRPLDWRAYFQRATLTLAQSGNLQQAASDFRRARFLEPNIGAVALKEGFAWIPYDRTRAVAAWREVLFREVDDRERTFRRMLDEARDVPELMQGLARLSEWDPDYRLQFLEYQSGDNFMEALEHDLKDDPSLSQFSRTQRTAILRSWIEKGDRDAAGAFLDKNESILNRPWWLRATLRAEQADFVEAVRMVRSAVEPPKMPEVPTAGVPLERLQREFSVMPGDLVKGTALLKYYIAEENFPKVREVTETMIAVQKDVPAYAFFWNAESYYHLQDYIESWYAYEEYFKRIWNE
jgi:hypothetical protein